MTAIRKIKKQLAKDLTKLYGRRGYYGIIAAKAEVSHETVRLWFLNADRRSAAVEKAALEFRTELIESNNAKLQSLQP